VDRGDAVVAGQPVVTVEAMKMEHVVRAPGAGVVVELDARVGQVVPLEAVLARLSTIEEGDAP
jgi:propionyl-CoA carboxylase alpha chain